MAINILSISTQIKGEIASPSIAWTHHNYHFPTEQRRYQLIQSVQFFVYIRAAEVDHIVSSLAISLLGAVVDISEKLYALSDIVGGTEELELGLVRRRRSRAWGRRSRWARTILP